MFMPWVQVEEELYHEFVTSNVAGQPEGKAVMDFFGGDLSLFKYARFVFGGGYRYLLQRDEAEQATALLISGITVAVTIGLMALLLPMHLLVCRSRGVLALMMVLLCAVIVGIISTAVIGLTATPWLFIASVAMLLSAILWARFYKADGEAAVMRNRGLRQCPHRRAAVPDIQRFCPKCGRPIEY